MACAHPNVAVGQVFTLGFVTAGISSLLAEDIPRFAEVVAVESDITVLSPCSIGVVASHDSREIDTIVVVFFIDAALRHASTTTECGIYLRADSSFGFEVEHIVGDVLRLALDERAA